LAGQGDLGIVDERQAGLEPIERLLHDLDGVVHLGHPHHEARPAVAPIVGGTSKSRAS
jgi:hypothetical protein